MVFYDDFLTGCKNTLFSFLLSRTCVIFNKFATEKNTVMKRNLIRILFFALISLVLVCSCDPMEPSTRTETLMRYATVRSDGTKAYLEFDGINETLRIKNFSTTSDMKTFNVKDGDRVLVTMSVQTYDNVIGENITIDYMSKIKAIKLATSLPDSTKNHYYVFDIHTLGRTQYPEIWSQGHYVNVTPVIFTHSSEIKKEPEFSLYPMYMKRDTLVTRLYLDFPESDFGPGYQALQDICSFDLSSLRETVADAQEQAHRDSILDALTELGNKYVIKIMTPPTFRSNYTLSNDSIKKLNGLKGGNFLSIETSFDF
jgi:hypothetical protein